MKVKLNGESCSLKDAWFEALENSGNEKIVITREDGTICFSSENGLNIHIRPEEMSSVRQVQKESKWGSVAHMDRLPPIRELKIPI